MPAEQIDVRELRLAQTAEIERLRAELLAAQERAEAANRMLARWDSVVAELQAAQEREKRLQSMIDNTGDLWADLRDVLKREKALREWIKGISFNEELPKELRNAAAAILWNTNLEALAASPSEKPE